MASNVGTYQRIPFPRSREITIDTVELAKRKNHIKGYIELDVTQGRECIRNLKKSTGKGLSFTGWMAKCISQAVCEHKQVHALRHGRRSMIIFHDVDILIMVNKTVDGSEKALPYIVRKTNEKSVQEIHEEIRAAQVQATEQNDIVLGNAPWYVRLYPRMPKILRQVIGRRILQDPFLIKQNVGTVEITAIGMMSNFTGWAFPISPQPLCFALGGIVRKPGVIGDTIVIREYLNMAFMIDHDVVDGVQVSRFITRLTELVSSGYGLPELT